MVELCYIVLKKTLISMQLFQCLEIPCIFLNLIICKSMSMKFSKEALKRGTWNSADARLSERGRSLWLDQLVTLQFYDRCKVSWCLINSGALLVFFSFTVITSLVFALLSPLQPKVLCFCFIKVLVKFFRVRLFSRLKRIIYQFSKLNSCYLHFGR